MSPEYKFPKLKLKIVSQKGTCAFNHKTGDKFDVSHGTPSGMCPGAYHSAQPSIFALMLGGSMPWEKDKNIAHVACPDPYNGVVMEIIREK